MNLEIKYNEDLKEHLVLLNGEIVGKTEAYFNKDKGFHVYFNNEIINLSIDNSIKDFFNFNITSFNFGLDTKEFQYLNWVKNDDYNVFFQQEMNCSLILLPQFLEWDKPFSILHFLQELELSLKKDNIVADFSDDLIYEGILITFNIYPEKSIFQEYNRILKLVNNKCSEIFYNLKENNLNNELLSVFSFPQEIKQACEQYLIYFSKFLQDLGIEVVSKIDSQTKTTFFTVIPLDSGEALINIKKLLDIYLSIPQTNDLETYSLNYNDVSVQQLMANVYHLKSQLILANSIIQNKDATIESLKLTTLHQNLIIDSKKSSNEEKAIDGLVTIGEFEWKGLKVNLAEVFRRLKRKFTK